MEDFTQFIKPELLILIPILNLAGQTLKLSPIKDWTIPFILGGLGILLSALYVFTGGSVPVGGVPTALFTSLTQGILAAGGSVYFNNLLKQAKEKRE